MNDKLLSERQWRAVKPLLPAKARTGRPRADDRQTLEAILYVLRTGCRWQDLPASLGSYSTAWRRFRSWHEDGTWERIWRTLLTNLDEEQRASWAQAFLHGSFTPTPRTTRRGSR